MNRPLFHKCCAVLLAVLFLASGQSVCAMALPSDSVEYATPISADRSDSLGVLSKTVEFADSISQACTDSLKAGRERKVDLERFNKWTPDPIRAMWIAMVVPGGGQIYNRKVWKLPIIYGGVLGCMYALDWNSQMLRDYSQAYQDLTDSDPSTNSHMEMLPLGYDITGREGHFVSVFKRKKDVYRRQRDLSIFAFAGVYLLSVLDAYIDAELSTFDIGRDLSLKVTPGMLPNDTPHCPQAWNAPATGVSFQLSY